MVGYRPRVAQNATKPRMGPTDKQTIKSKNSRSPHSARTIKFSTGVTSQASGSAMFEQGNTKIICSVYGPKAIRRNIEISEDGVVQCHVKLAPFSMYKLNSSNSNYQNEDFRIKSENSLSSRLLRAIQGSIITDQFPKSVLEIHALVLSDDGGVHAGLVSCATMALANSGVALYDLVPCCSVGLGADGLVFDAHCTATLDLALMPASDSVTDMNVNGVMTFDTTGEAVSLCFAGCMLIYKQMQAHLVAEAKLQLTNK